MLTTTGRSCLTMGASDGMGPAWRTVSAVVGAAGAACASAANIEDAEGLRWQAETSGRAARAAGAPEITAARTLKRRGLAPPRAAEQRDAAGTSVTAPQWVPNTAAGPGVCPATLPPHPPPQAELRP